MGLPTANGCGSEFITPGCVQEGHCILGCLPSGVCHNGLNDTATNGILWHPKSGVIVVTSLSPNGLYLEWWCHLLEWGVGPGETQANVATLDYY